MAVKFPLEMKNGIMARNMSEVRENFDIEKIVSYFLEGKLLTWLEARYYEEEAEAVSVLTKNDTQLVKKLHQIFGIEFVEEKEIDTEEIKSNLNLEGLSEQEAKEFKKLLTKFVKSYSKKEQSISDVEWLASEFKDTMPELSKEEAKKMAEDTVEAIKEYD